MTMYHSINMIQDMRKHIYIIMVMLLGCLGQLRAQDAVSIVGYEYWFDANFDARLKVDTTSTPGNSIFINEKAIDASGLSEGLHHLYIRALNSKNLFKFTIRNKGCVKCDASVI